MQQYYVLQVVSGQEKKVKKALEEAMLTQGLSESISEILMPTEQISEVRNGKSRTAERPVWRGYLILKMDLTDDAWGKVLNIPGVLRFPGGDRHGKPTPLKEEEA